MSQIDTGRLQLRFPLTDVDPRHIEWLNDKKLMRWSEQRYREHTVETQDYFLIDAHARGNPICFDIILQDADRPLPNDYGRSIGTIHAYLDKRHRRADLGIMLGPQYHGKGYAREAWRAVEEYLHEECDIDKFEAGTASGNGPMIGLLLSLGYGEEGLRKHHFLIDGREFDLELFGKLIL